MASRSICEKLLPVLVTLWAVGAAQGQQIHFAELSVATNIVSNTTNGSYVREYDFASLIPAGATVVSVGVSLEVNFSWTSSSSTVVLGSPDGIEITMDQVGGNAEGPATVVYTQAASSPWAPIDHEDENWRYYIHRGGDTYEMLPMQPFTPLSETTASGVWYIKLLGAFMTNQQAKLVVAYQEAVAADPDGDVPSDDTPSDDSPSDDTPSDDTPSDDTPSDDTPSDDTPADDTPGDDTGGDSGPDTNNDGLIQGESSGDSFNYGALNENSFSGNRSPIGQLDPKRAIGSNEDSWLGVNNTIGGGTLPLLDQGFYDGVSVSEHDTGPLALVLPLYTGPLASLGDVTLEIEPPEYWPVTWLYAFATGTFALIVFGKLVTTFRQY